MYVCMYVDMCEIARMAMHPWEYLQNFIKIYARMYTCTHGTCVSLPLHPTFSDRYMHVCIHAYMAPVWAFPYTLNFHIDVRTYVYMHAWYLCEPPSQLESRIWREVRFESSQMLPYTLHSHIDICTYVYMHTWHLCEPFPTPWTFIQTHARMYVYMHTWHLCEPPSQLTSRYLKGSQVGKLTDAVR